MSDKRVFDTGALRDTAAGKLDYVKGLSMRVVHRYMVYLDSHRTLPDGSLREFDNWKKGIPEPVYLSSLARHVLDEVRLCEGEKIVDNHGPVEEEDLLCAIMFNAMGKLYEVMKRRNEAKDRPVPKARITPVPKHKPLRVYVSHFIRGKSGKDATQAEIQANCAAAIVYTERMRAKLPGVDFYCPAEHEDFVGLAHRLGLLTEEKILEVDCGIIDGCDVVLFYNPGGFMSNGMIVEVRHATAIRKHQLREFNGVGCSWAKGNTALHWLKVYADKKSKGEAL